MRRSAAATNDEGWQAAAELDAGNGNSLRPLRMLRPRVPADTPPCQAGRREVEGEDSIFEEAI